MFPARILHVVRDLDGDDEQGVVQTIAATIEQRFRDEGYVVNRHDEKLKIAKEDTNQSLELSLANVHGAGDPNSLPGIKQHEFEDYIILIYCKTKEKNPASVQYESSKAALHSILNSADLEKIVPIISKCNAIDLPESLTSLVTAITE